MSRRVQSKKPANDAHVSVPIRMPEALEAKIEDASARTGLAKQDVMRLSIDRGLDILIAQLTSRPAMPEDTATA